MGQIPLGCPTGVVSDFYDTRAGERVWIIVWKGSAPPPVVGESYFCPAAELGLGDHVAFHNGLLERLG